ncbi:MAG: minor extracellular serine protease Vpr, partial [Alteromonadaceae bacterium]
PSCVEPGLSVASSVHGRFFANTATFGSLTGLLAIPSAATTLSEDITGTVVVSLTADPENFEGCNAFPADSFTGNIALISRGACSFFDKINNAEAAGATAVIIYNNRAGAPIVQGGVDGINIPSIMISQTDGLAILEMLSDEVNQVTIGHATERVMVAESIDAMSGFSSRGPNGDQNSLKPDITAPGSNILSGVSPEDSGGDTYGILSGTSMAAPHISGAAAIMRQTFPDWSAIDIKTAMTSTSKMGLKKEDYVTATDAFDVGAGRIDLSTSTMAAATFDKPSMAMNPCIVTCNFTRTINNKMDHEMTWTATVTFDDPAFTGSVYPSTVTLGAMGGDDPDAEFVVKVDGSNSDVEGWAFGQVTWTNSMGAAMHPDAHMAIAVAIDRSILGTTATGSGGIGDTMQMTSLFTNTNDMFEEQVRIDIKAPMGTKIVAGSETSALNEATQFALDNDDVANRLSWTGTFNKAAFVTEAIAAPIGGSIADFGASLINCGDACDDVSTDIDLSGNDLSFAYNGQRYSALSISSNGYIILGGGDARTASNQDLPSADEPNNVIAPFWTDLDLSKNDSGTGGGDMYIGLFDLGPAVYVGIEWKDAQLWGDDTGKKYNFQAWISTGETQDVFFEYGLLDATLPARLTVGAEDGQGVTGSSFHFNGAGNAVMGDSGVQVSTAPAGNVQLGYDIQVTGPLNLGVADTIDTSEDAAASSVTPLANDKTTDDKVIDIKFSHAGKSFSTPKTIQTTAEGELDVTSLMIVTQPMHGAATDNGDGTFSYTAEADFNGMDSFTYDAADAAGVRMAPTTVWVNVASVNDVPVFTAETPTEASGTEGGSVTLTASATDVDSEELTYSWAQTAGTEAVLAGADTGEVTITLPEVAAGGETLSFTVSANDGTDTVDHVVAVTVADVPPPVVAPTTTNRSGGGSTGLLALLLMPLAFVRRRLAK